MRVLVIAQHGNLFRNLDTVIRELCRRGHEIVFLHGTDLDNPKVRRKLERRRTYMPFWMRGLDGIQSEMSALTIGYRPMPTERWQQTLGIGRQVMNRAIYFRETHPDPVRIVHGIERELPPDLVRRINTRAWKAVLSRPAALRVWRWIEEESPVSETVASLLTNVRPHVMIVSPTVWPKKPVETDYFRAARHLGIPSIGYVNSWDNLTTKGTTHIVPDVYVVWNEAMAQEAIDLHLVSPKRIRIAGAPHFDYCFTMRSTKTAAALGRDMACPPNRPYVLFLCTSPTLIQSEVGLVTRLADALARQLGSRAPMVVVRPHPTNGPVWEGFTHPGVVVYPPVGDQADSAESWQDYFNQLAHAACVVALNTTGFLEAAVLDKPCVTIVAEEFWPAQGGTAHFRHLLQGDFLEIARDVNGVASRIGQLLDGHDERAPRRREFVRRFVRPCGIVRPGARVGP
jgi:hypothetical protein